jgi:hypothetical protein
MNIWEGDRMWVIAPDHEVKSYERCRAGRFFNATDGENLNEKENIQSWHVFVELFVRWLRFSITVSMPRKNSSPHNTVERIRAPRWASPRDSEPQGAPLPPKAERGRSPLQRIFDTGLADRQAGHVWSRPGNGGFFPFLYRRGYSLRASRYKDTFMIYVPEDRTCARVMWCELFMLL